MTLVRDKVRKTFSGEFSHRVFGRVKCALKTKKRTVAIRRHAALELLLDTGEPVRDLVERLRRQRMTIQSVEECVRAKLPFDALRASIWPPLSVAAGEHVAALTLKNTTADKTARNAKAVYRHAIAFFGARRTLESITHEDVSAFKMALEAKSLHPNTVSHYLTRFGALYTFLQRRETRRAQQQKRTPNMLFSPLDRIEHVAGFVPSRLRFLSQEEAVTVFAAAPKSLVASIAVGIFAGLRAGEICHLRRDLDVDLSAGMLHIQSRKGWQPKYGKHRDVPISAVLRPYLEAASELHTDSPYLFPAPTNANRPMTLRYLERYVARVVVDAELIAGQKDPNGVTVHTLRHTFASWLVMAGADLFTISKLMGHSGIRQVEQTYGHLSPKHTRKTVELLGTDWLTHTTTHTTDHEHVA